MRLTVTGSTTVEQLNQFLKSAGDDHMVLAKKTLTGKLQLYTRGDTEVEGRRTQRDVSRNTKLHGEKMDRYSAKLQRGREVVRDLVDKFSGTIGKQIRMLSNGDNAIPQGRLIHDLSGFSNRLGVLMARPLNVSMATTGIESLLTVANRFTTLLSKKTQTPPEPQTFPPTENRVTGRTSELEDTKGTKFEAPYIDIGKNIYTPVNCVGVGGFGRVVVYAHEDKQVVVKLPLAEPERDQESLSTHNKGALRELNNALKMGGSDFVSGFTQHVKLESGYHALIGELLPNGSVESFAKSLSDPVNMNPPLTFKERKLVALTLIKDSAMGLDHINTTGKTRHMDMKSGNVMIDGNGRARVIDLGISEQTDRITLASNRFAGNILYQSPEVNDLMEGKQVERANTRLFNNLVGNLIDKFGLNKGEQTRSKYMAIDELFDSMKVLGDLALPLARHVDPIGTTDSFDTFGLGTMAFELLVGGGVTDDVPSTGFVGKIGGIMDWISKKTDAIGPDGLTTRGTNDEGLDRFLNQMLSSDPNTRLTPSGVSGHEVMTTAGVGQPEVRALIRAIAGGDAEKIRQARQTLSETY